MKKKKILISLILSIVLIIGNTLTCFCAVNPYTMDDLLDDVQYYIEGGGIVDTLKIFHTLCQVAGGMIDDIKSIVGIKEAIHEVDPSITTSSTDEEVDDWIKDRLSIVNNNVSIDNSLRSAVVTYMENYEEDYEYIQGYTIDLSGWLGIDNQTFINLVKDNQDDNYLLWFNNITGYNGWRLLLIPKTNTGIRFLYTGEVQNNDDVKLCRITNTLGMTGDPRTLFQNCTVYNGNGNIISSGDNFSTNNTYFAVALNLGSNDFALTGSQFWLVSYEKTYNLIINKTSAGLENENTGVAPYYYNNSVWQDFSNTQGDYVVTSENINTVTYGDILSYIDSYNQDNDNYPDNSTVNTWIENTNDENTSGGGGGSNEDNGGGSGGPGDSEGIFDFLSELGKVLGNLIKNVGQAFVNIIKGISDLIESIVTDLPTVFFDFIGSMFSWLPDEWVMLMSLSLAAMLIWGVIKVIRG